MILKYLLGLFLSIFVFAAQEAKSIETLEIDNTRQGWDIAFEYINLNFSSTSIKNQSPYTNFSNTHFKGNSQIIAEGSLLFHSNYYTKNFVIFNHLSSEYGRNIIYPADAKIIDNTTTDKIIISTDYTQKLWNIEKFGGFTIGPYIQFYYQTQFFSTAKTNHTNILHLGSGFKIFDGKYVKSFYINIFAEEDLTYKRPVQNIGYNIGAHLQYSFNHFAKLVGYIGFKHYLYNNYPIQYKPQYEFEIKTRIETAIFKYFSIAPFINFYLLKGQEIKKPATNLMIGVSLSYGQTYISAKVLKKENED